MHLPKGSLTQRATTLQLRRWIDSERRADDQPESRPRNHGKNFFGVEEAMKHFGVNPTCQQLAALSEIPFSETVLKQSKDDHILVAVFPLSILEIRDKVERKLFYNHETAWYNEQSLPRSMAKSTGNSFVRPSGQLDLGELARAAGTLRQGRHSAHSSSDGLHDYWSPLGHW